MFSMSPIAIIVKAFRLRQMVQSFTADRIVIVVSVISCFSSFVFFFKMKMVFLRTRQRKFISLHVFWTLM